MNGKTDSRFLRTIAIGVLCVVMLVGAGIGLVGCGTNDSTNSSTSSTANYKLVNAGKLTIGCSADYRPMEYTKDGKITGFSYGLMSEIAKRLGLECNFLSTQNFDTLITQVAAGTTMDVACSSITINDERQQLIDFSDPYFDSNLAIVVLKSSGYKSKADLEGVTVGAQSGTSGEDWVKENLKDDKYVPYQETTDALAALRTGKIKALVYDEPVAQNHVANEYNDCKILETIPTGEQYGIAINKSNTALKDAINKALADMKADGTLDKLKKTYIEGKAE